MEMFQETSVAGIFQKQVKKLGNKGCVAYKREGKYEDISWNRMNEMIRGLGSFLISQGIQPGDKVGLFSPNRYEWWVSDQAILSIGAVNVPIYATNSADEAKYVLDHSESKACLVGNPEHLEKVLQVRDSLPNLKFIVVFDSINEEISNVFTYEQALEQGKTQNNTTEFEARLSSIKPSDLATLIYTSGTTGPPKGVMLSHNNFLSNVNQVINEIKDYFSDDDVFLSFCPLSHSLERTAGYYIPMSLGAKVAFAESFQTVPDNLKEVRPSIIISVPRLYEKIHAGILAKVAGAPFLKKLLFNWSVSVAAENLPYVCNNKPRGGIFSLQYAIADTLIFSKLKEALGMDKMKFAISGGGPLSKSDAEFFLGMGIKVLEGFGLTETTPVTNANRPWLIKPGTVGAAVKDTTIKISDIGEVLIKGPQVMMGYYRNEDATKEVFTEDGFFKTGDLGSIDEDGYLIITGRIKEIIITAGGKNISPQNIENAIKTSKYVEQIAIIGDRRKFLSALIVPAFPELKAWAEQQGIVYKDLEELTQNEKVIKLYASEIDENTKQFSRVEGIKKFKLLSNEWQQQTGELTPTLKLKRRIVEQKYAKEIESMYAEK
ncbi:MAG: long-chain fatty acid--CoA ligase [Desulfobacterales bacterium]|nr:long-chain fatty acid--CoA ligase [Desulfobacterales bacterium]